MTIRNIAETCGVCIAIVPNKAIHYQALRLKQKKGKRNHV